MSRSPLTDAQRHELAQRDAAGVYPDDRAAADTHAYLAELVGEAGETSDAVSPIAWSHDAVWQRIGNEETPRRLSRPLVGGLVTAAAAIVAVVVAGTSPTSEPTLTARSAADNTSPVARLAGISTFVHVPAASPRLLVAEDVVPAHVGFSFELVNRSKLAVEIMLFGIDAAGDLHWFYPAWTDPASNPSAITVAPTSARHPLPDGISPEQPAAGRFTLVSLLRPATPQDRLPLTVQAIEAHVEAHGLARLSTISSDIIADTTTITLEASR